MSWNAYTIDLEVINRHIGKRFTGWLPAQLVLFSLVLELAFAGSILFLPLAR
jgi:hypothetical protein